MDYTLINRKGRAISVPLVEVNGDRIVLEGRFIKTALVYDEEWLPGQRVERPEEIVSRLKEEGVDVDILRFSQKLPNTQPLYKYHVESDNVAAITLKTFDDWWLALPQVTRKNVRRSAKRGVVVEPVELNDALLAGITAIFNADPVRQGVRNAHYGKDFATVKTEVSTYSETSKFIGAYFKDELIGYIKLVYVGPLASLMNIVAKDAHHDKRPMNALIAKAVEIACQKGQSFLIYGKYHYGNKGHDALAEFKRRNGFESITLPTYFVPLTTRGRIAIALRLHQGPLGFLPRGAIEILLRARRKIYKIGIAQRLLFGQRLNAQLPAEV